MFALDYANSSYIAVTTSSVQFGATLAVGQLWRFQASQDGHLNQAANPTASAANGNVFVRAGETVYVDGAAGAKVAFIGLVAGHATLTPMRKLNI